jgi:SAM-dependent methyltransferase
MLMGEAVISSAAPFWDELHEQRRFRPAYPNEHVVRFLMRHYSNQRDELLRALDIGVGGGRHTKLLCELGFDAYGIDISLTELKFALGDIAKSSRKAQLSRASMIRLPFRDESCDVVISVGVFYYGYARDERDAIQECWRILKRGGRAFVIVRSTRDYRFGKGKELEPNTYRMESNETNEMGTIQHFLTEEAVCEYFSSFSRLDIEKAETTFMGRRALNSDWLITAQK